MSQQSPVVRARVSKLRSGFLAGGGMASGEAPSYAAAAPEAGAGGGEQGGLPARPKVVISSLNQPPADDEKGSKEVSFSGPTTTYEAPSHIGSKRFMGYSWSKPLRDPELTKRVKSKRKKKIPLESRLSMLSPEADAVSRSLNLPRDAAVKGRGRVNASLQDLPHAPSVSSWLGESSMESIGDGSLADGSIASIDSHSFSEGEGGHDLEAGSGEEGGGIGPEDSMESVVSIKDLLDRKKGELSDVESKYKDVKEGKVKPNKTERKKVEKPVPAVIVANALMQENLASELSVLKATLSLHSLTNQCGEHLQEVWGIKSESKKSASPDRTFSPDKSLSDSEADNGDNSFADVPAADKCMPMKKIIRKEIRKVNALHEAKLVKPPVQGFTRLRSPRREENDIDPAAMMRARRKQGFGVVQNRILSKKELRVEAVVIKGPKLVRLTPQYKNDFTGLLELCDAIQLNSTLTSLDISDNWIQPEGMKKLLAPSLRFATRLAHLDLTRNDIRQSGMNALALTLRELSGLKSLVLADNNIGDPGASALALPLVAYTQLLKLDLQSNGISAAGLQALEPPLKLLSQLRSLEVSGNVKHFSHESSEGPEFMASLMPSLCELTNLTHLGLASNVLLTGGAKTLARVLGDLRHSLISLDLGGRLHAHNRIGAVGMKTLSAGLFWTPLQMLDVSFNDLRVEGANSLALVLSIHTSLTEISLRGNGIGSQGVRSLIASLVKHPRIRALDLADNDLNSEALKYVCEGLPQFTALNRLSLAYNRLVAAANEVLISAVDYEGIDQFTDIMLHTHLYTQITSLDVKDSGLDQHALRGMVHLVKKSTTLKELNTLDLSKATATLPPKLDNYELLYVSKRLTEIENAAPDGIIRSLSAAGGSSSLSSVVGETKKRKIDVSEFTTIDLSSCDFQEFPHLLVRLRNLRELDLSGNPLIRLPVKQIMDFNSLHDIYLKDCPLLLHPPRCIANKGEVVEYMRECKLYEDKVKIPLIVTGEVDSVTAIFLKPIFGGKCNAPTNRTTSNADGGQEIGDYKPAGTTREATKGSAAQLLPSETRWTPEGVHRTFSLVHVFGTGLIPACRPFVQVQRAINVYAVQATGGNPKHSMVAYLDRIYADNQGAVVAIVIVHDGEIEESDLQNRCEIVASVLEHWRSKWPADQPSPRITEPLCINTNLPESYHELAVSLAEVSAVLVAPEGDWVHPVVARMQDHLANVAQRGHFWITWKAYFVKLNEVLDELDAAPMMCVQTVTEVLHAIGVIRCVGPTKDKNSLEKPVLDTVVINMFKMQHYLCTMPEECHSWKEWQVVEHLRTAHKKAQRRWQSSALASSLAGKLCMNSSKAHAFAAAASAEGVKGIDVAIEFTVENASMGTTVEEATAEPRKVIEEDEVGVVAKSSSPRGELPVIEGRGTGGEGHEQGDIGPGDDIEDIGPGADVVDAAEGKEMSGDGKGERTLDSA